MNGPSMVHLELSAQCNKSCPNCQRRVAEIEAPDIVRQWGFMPMDMVRMLADDLPGGIVLSLHGRGEPLMFPRLQEALMRLSSKNRILHFDSNIKLLVEKADEVIDNLDVLTVSLLEGNSYESEVEQFTILTKFLKIRRDRKPRVVIRMTGNVSNKVPWYQTGLPVVTRPLHARHGRAGYTRAPVAPEFHICLEMLQRLFIDYEGNVRPCVRYDIWGENIIGHLEKDYDLWKIWNGMKRQERLMQHIAGKRLGFCATCQYWGLASGG